MLKKILSTFILISLIFPIPLDSNDDNWYVVQDKDIWIGFLDEEYPWCRGESLLNASLTTVLDAIQDVENYHTFFKSVFISEINSNDEVHIVFDLPLFFADRDYAVNFFESNNDTMSKYYFKAINSDTYPLDKRRVRLVNFEGSWYLEKVNDEQTIVKYTWNCEMLGKFPTWAYSKACGIGGNEVLSGLIKEVEKRKNK